MFRAAVLRMAPCENDPGAVISCRMEPTLWHAHAVKYHTVKKINKHTLWLEWILHTLREPGRKSL